jgi:NAD(P)-dependent dehydrogenase (short-subunit alcohol dehydrogenase family)
MTDVSLDGRTAIVTGAGNGIGRAEALGLAAAGARVVINDLDGNGADDTAAAIRAAGGSAVTSVGDIGEWSTAEDMVATALREFGRLDILVNNAGVLRDKMIFSMSPEDFDLVVRTHLRGHFLTSRAATAYWRDQSKQAGGEVYARIINTSSEAFLIGATGQPNYAAAKGGIAAMTVTIARSCARYGVRANAILPRARTAMVGGLLGEAPADGPDPLSPEYVAPLVTYLASPAAANINGELFLVHGGVVAVIAPPTISATFLAQENGSPDGMWTLDAVASALEGFATTNPEGAGFFCGDTLAMASATIGFGGR